MTGVEENIANADIGFRSIVCSGYSASEASLLRIDVTTIPAAA